MLVRFHSKAAGAVTMFGDIAVELLRLMGMSGVVPGAVLAKDVPGALRRLREAVESEAGERVSEPPRPGGRKPGDKEEKDENADGPAIKLRTRAYPLLQLLEESAAAKCDVVWEDSDKATG